MSREKYYLEIYPCSTLIKDILSYNGTLMYEFVECHTFIAINGCGRKNRSFAFPAAVAVTAECIAL
jgi:hypothetical protein